MPSRLSSALVLPFLWLFVACHTDKLVAPIAIRAAAEKSPEPVASELSRHASKTFREALYDARYSDLPEARRLLTAAYLENPADPEIALLLAHSHLWTLSERSRIGDARDPGITDFAILAEHYFGEAGKLAPYDDRIAGWHGGVRLALGEIHADERTTRTGYFQLRESVRRYPEFNGFSAAFPLSGQPRDSERFAEAVDLMWLNLEECGGVDFDRESFDYAAWMDSRTASGRKRVCWNTDTVPHNFEGFFLFMGDLLTKTGDVDNAARAYRAAKLAPEFSQWRFAPVLEARLANLGARAAAFARAEHPSEEPEMMFGSDYACTGCHAR